jgi:hypothetical protein
VDWLKFWKSICFVRNVDVVSIAKSKSSKFCRKLWYFFEQIRSFKFYSSNSKKKNACQGGDIQGICVRMWLSETPVNVIS